ncbi:MAG: hypothetical protein JNN24_07545 [Hyphomicrobium zavarzinii]|uniref:hypothetical protein n=1 Tax=Hyphomicrobium zavarzinii TaxID=48292 RepID=UPI001A577E76|nr:hypothetical protein [Hyphomicrobium zavarzinii]MBL8845609.1 hypothetical protein [Hyphomicrobium zavarzinii]
MSQDEKQQTIELTYPCHTIDGTNFICSRALAKELIADALKLLAPVHVGNMDAAWNEFLHMGAPVARELDDEAKAGGQPGIVLTVPARGGICRILRD